MRKIIKHNRVESVTYEFDIHDIKLALMAHFGIKPSGDYEFELYEAWEDSPQRAELIIRYSEPAEEDD